MHQEGRYNIRTGCIGVSAGNLLVITAADPQNHRGSQLQWGKNTSWSGELC